MRTTSLAIFVFFAWIRPLAAEQFIFQETPGVVAYRVANNYFSATVRHPFRVVRLSGRNLKGTYRFNPAAADKGFLYNLELDVSDLDEPEGALGQAVAKILGAPKIVISGDSFANIRYSKKDEMYHFVVRPRIEIGNSFAYPEVRVAGLTDGKVIRWIIQSEFNLSDFSIPLPTKWGIPSEDRVKLEGEISFAPKE